MLIQDTDYNSIETAIRRVFELFPIHVGDKHVLVKPNMLGPYGPETHVNTHPAVIRALLDVLLEKGATVTVGDNPGTQGYGAVGKSARVSGIKDAAGHCFSNIGTEVTGVKLPGRRADVSVSSAVVDCDILISVPKFKTHTFTRLTGAIKNSLGFVVGGDKARLHLDFPDYREFSDILVDVYRIRIPDLVIVDGVVGMHGNGPSNRSLYEVGKLLASDNGVALDTVMAHMMRMKPGKVRMIEYAGELGLGETDISRIDVMGDARPLKGFRKPVPSIPQIFGSTWTGTFFPDLGRPSFDIDTYACNSCGSCAEACPVDAIEMVEERPRYDYSKCVACYCCMELCPRQAISLHETLRTRLYRLMGYLQ